MMMKRDFISRSLESALAFIKDATLCEEHACHKGFLQSIEPRIKTLTILGFILTVAFLKSAHLIGLLYLLCLMLVMVSQIPLGFFLVRTWVFIPIFSLGMAIPALFSSVSPGESVYSFQLMGVTLMITRQGIDAAVLFVVRVTTSVSWAVLLSLTTRHGELLKVLRVFGVPRVFILTVFMCYRYLYILAVMVENIFLALRSRVGVVTQHQKGRHVVAWNMANTWNRTAQMSEDVYKAMLSRGYTGEPQMLIPFHMGWKDVAWLLCSVVMCAGFLYAGYRI
ncbi:MAG: cobalt ECF transporter T component CbiQ [Candidatus Omnitrophota bacterium]